MMLGYRCKLRSEKFLQQPKALRFKTETSQIFPTIKFSAQVMEHSRYFEMSDEPAAL